MTRSLRTWNWHLRWVRATACSSRRVPGPTPRPMTRYSHRGMTRRLIARPTARLSIWRPRTHGRERGPMTRIACYGKGMDAPRFTPAAAAPVFPPLMAATLTPRRSTPTARWIGAEATGFFPAAPDRHTHLPQSPPRCCFTATASTVTIIASTWKPRRPTHHRWARAARFSQIRSPTARWSCQTIQRGQTRRRLRTYPAKGRQRRRS